MNKVNYQKILDGIISNLQKTNTVPTLLCMSVVRLVQAIVLSICRSILKSRFSFIIPIFLKWLNISTD